MNSNQRRRNGACLLIFAAMSSALVACSSGESNGPSTSTTTTTTTSTSEAPAPSETEKSINPTGGNLFTPPITAQTPAGPAPGNLPGNHPKN